jgi:thiosulfate/3-mercaptopyruvate sulfurtransferase
MPRVPHLVEARWLAEHIGDAGVRVVDCRFVLGDPDGGRRAFGAGHIRGAAFVDVDTDLAAPPAPAGPRGPVGGRHPLPPAAALEAALRSAGVSDDSHVIAYDAAMEGGAARLWWLARHHGFDRVSVLRGGLAAWPGPLEEGRQAPRAAGDVTLGPPRDDDVIDAAALERAAAIAADGGGGGGAAPLVLDARAAARFRGETEPIDPVAGHIPGAVNLPFAENLENGRYKSAEALRAMYEELLDGTPVERLVVHCGSGVTACHTLLALEAADLRGASLYVGSWGEWCRNQ